MRSKKCPNCQKVFFKSGRKSYKRWEQTKFCSLSCYQSQRKGVSRPYMWGRFLAEKSSNWRGGRYKSDGYVWVYCPEHPTAKDKRYVLEHRLIVEKFLGRYLKKAEFVHHKDGKRDNNKLNNLVLLNAGEHSILHSKDREVAGWSRKYASCVLCGKTTYKHAGRGLCKKCYRKEGAVKRREGRWRKVKMAVYEDKSCQGCGKPLSKPKTPREAANWSVKRFCSTGCRVKNWHQLAKGF